MAARAGFEPCRGAYLCCSRAEEDRSVRANCPGWWALGRGSKPARTNDQDSHAAGVPSFSPYRVSSPLVSLRSSSTDLLFLSRSQLFQVFRKLSRIER